MPWITSANIACGAHAGDDDTIRATLRLCLTYDVTAGAHPGYDDRAHFGRRELALSADEIRALVHAQIERVRSIADGTGVKLHHVKPHGALYNLSARDPSVALAIAEAVRGIDPGLVLVGLSGSHSIRAAETCGLCVAHEVFAERSYAADGQLLARSAQGAVIASLGASIAQTLDLALHGRVRAVDGSPLALRADTLCLHGDRDDAAAFAHALRKALETAGVDILPFGAAR
jgi:5-oxoprolinase (ATP-hydrolysing) subunit A